MKKRSNITLLILLLLLFSIPFAAYFHFRRMISEAEKNPKNKGLKEIRLKTSDQDSIQISFHGDNEAGIQIKTSVKKH
jgi:hypothetical protein